MNNKLTIKEEIEMYGIEKVSDIKVLTELSGTKEDIGMTDRGVQRRYIEECDVIYINKIENIDRTTDEGKLLMMAINRLNFTVDKELTFNEILQKLKDMHRKIYG